MGLYDVVIKSTIPILNIRGLLGIAKRTINKCRKCKGEFEIKMVDFLIVGADKKISRLPIKFCPNCYGDLPDKAVLSVIINGKQFSNL